jgi:RNA polymerase sigma-70 factor (ECF subfamily)
VGDRRQPDGEDRQPIDFDDFYRLHRDRLYRALVLTTREPDIAVEAVDEAMTRASERWDTVGTYENPAGWVYRVALNWARSFFRRRRRVGPEVAEVTWDKLPDPDVNDAVAALPYKHRSVIVARFYLDWSTPQIAAGLGLPLGTVKSRLHRALASLEETLGGER